MTGITTKKVLMLHDVSQQTSYPKTLEFSAVDDSSLKATIRRLLEQNAKNLFVSTIFADFTRTFLFHYDATYRKRHAEQKDQK